MENSLKIKMRVDVMGTLRDMQQGQVFTTRSVDFAPYSTAASCVSRLNKEGRNYSIVPAEFGTKYTITCHI